MASRADGNRIPASHPPGYAAVFLRVVLIVFMAEFLVMELLGLLPARLVESISARQILLPILDAALLVILIAPPIYFWAIKPYVEGRRAMAGVLAMASHELRTPLNGIAGLIDIAADAPDDPELPGYLKIAAEDRGTYRADGPDPVLLTVGKRIFQSADRDTHIGILHAPAHGSGP